MRRATLLLSLCLLLFLLFSLQFSAANLSLRVNEKGTRLELAGSQTVMAALAVENMTGRSLRARIIVELLDPKDKVRAQVDKQEDISAGRSYVRLPLSFDLKKLESYERNEFPWYRLRYHIAPEPDTGASSTGGIISLSEITPELFELRVSAAQHAREGAPYQVRVLAMHPVTNTPVAGVQVTGEVELDDNPSGMALQSNGVTDAKGYAILGFGLPSNVGDKEAEIRVVGRLKGFEQEAEATIDFDRRARIMITTDKTLYQPGQTLHLRALVFDASERAVPDAETVFEIEDPEGTTQFRASLKTTRFGVAATDWQIPENTPLGDYSIRVEMDEDRYGEGEAFQMVKISRYDLPNFTVSAKTDRAYYMPGQNAEAEVRADYLFGQPLKRGRVRVVRETERSWDFKEQKWETEEGEEIEGELDERGRFIAHLDLVEEHEDLADEDYARFRDLNYAAYLTDETTNRTEQRRFSVRITREPIHIYVVEGGYDQAEGLPLAFFVSTSYADGTPAQCELSMEVAETGSDVKYYGRPSALIKGGREGASLSVIKTNRYGVAKIEGPPVGRVTGPHRYLSIKLTARDSKGRTGRHTEDLWLNDSSLIRVETDRAVYRAGEPLRVSLISNKEDATVFVDVVSDRKVVRSESVRLEDGLGQITLPYSKEFDGRLLVVASFYERTEQSYSSGDVIGRRLILYPRDRELKVKVELSRTLYRPGEEARASLRALGPDGRALESVLGVVVFDKAVEERARTDSEFSSSYGFYDYFHYFRYGSNMVAGISLRDLERMDVRRKPVTAELNLVADMLLQNMSAYYERTSFESGRFEKNRALVFSAITNPQMAPLKKALEARYLARAEYPSDPYGLGRFLKESGMDFDQLRDPWGAPYRASFSVVKDSDVLEIMSAGPDKQAGTTDDFSVEKFTWPYFRPTGERLDRIIYGYHERAGGFIRNLETLNAELARAGFDRDALRDRWGEPYRFEFGTQGTLLYVKVLSGGPDRRFDQHKYGTDDFTVWTTWVDSFSDKREAIEKALDAYLKETGRFPQDDNSFRDALKRAGIDTETLHDPHGRAYFVNFKTESRYVDRMEVEWLYRADAPPVQRTKVTPVSQRVYFIRLFSAGADSRGGTGDDFTAATFTNLAFEQAANDNMPQSVQPQVMLAGATGAITGVVKDVTEAVITGASVVARHKYGSMEFSTVTDDEGKYLLRNLPSGHYMLTVTAAGFSTVQMVEVPVRSSALIKIDLTLQPAGITETVSVTAASDSVVNATSAQLSVVEVRRAGPRPAQLATPRLREFFPETLVWQPSLETDKQGRAELSFRLADNITTWKMSIIGSTLDGELGTVEKEFKAFQPFFVEHDPPRILTEGDEIALPVVLRNYLERPQAVELQMKPESWFALMGAADKRAEVRAGDAAREVFNFRATASVKDGKQRVTAIGGEASDAIERAVTVHPDGEERAATDSRVFRDAATLETEIPMDAITGTLRGEVKIYPNLVGHVFESIEGILARPYGCGEQTISSTYPSLLVLKAYRRNNLAPPENMAPRASRYLADGYRRLLNYRAEGGGFSYWGGGSDPNLALTAYALRFLMDAEEFIEVDDEVRRGALNWLIKAQRADGSWPAYLRSDGKEEPGSPMVTALVARSIALSAKREGKSATPDAQKDKTAREALRLALDYLSRKAEEADEPYLIASYGLASIDAGEDERAARAIGRLRALAREEGDRTYWALETNTPFYGWGLAGRIETSALAVQALARGASLKSAPETDELINRGLLFLLKQKDRYGVWYSTQATINVLDALIALLSITQTPSASAAHAAEILVNGKPAGTIQLPPANQLTGPITLDISKYLMAGHNRVEILRGVRGGPQASAQLVSSYYLQWPKALSEERRLKGASALSLAVDFDKTETGVMNEVTCKVRAERVGHKGYGMLLGEIGLPPGADVDRASLERAMKESGWSFARYDILPDRLVVYLWPQAGGTAFEFKFRPRFGLRALSAPSVLYDYYNPEARTALAPVKFTVR